MANFWDWPELMAAIHARNTSTRISAGAVDFDGANDYMTRGAALTGLVDGKKGTFSGWVRLDGSDGSLLAVFYSATAAAPRLVVQRAITNIFRISASNSAASTILDLRTSNSYTAGTTWYHILSSWDLGTAGARHLYINGVSDLSVTTFINDTIDYAMATPNWAIGAQVDGNTKFDGCMAEIFFHADYIDLSDGNNRAKFYQGGPAFLGSDGSLPFAATPTVYQRLAGAETVTNFATNRGGGGDFSITGSLDAASSLP